MPYVPIMKPKSKPREKLLTLQLTMFMSMMVVWALLGIVSWSSDFLIRSMYPKRIFCIILCSTRFVVRVRFRRLGFFIYRVNKIPLRISVLVMLGKWETLFSIPRKRKLTTLWDLCVLWRETLFGGRLVFTVISWEMKRGMIWYYAINVTMLRI